MSRTAVTPVLPFAFQSTRFDVLLLVFLINSFVWTMSTVVDISISLNEIIAVTGYPNTLRTIFRPFL